jgi:pyrimidine deaminase RibD-like protein
MTDAVQAVIENAGLKVAALKEWCVDWVPNQKFREDLSSSTLYLTLEPSPEAKGEMQPAITKLIEQAGIPNVVIGCPSPIPELAYKGATALHMAGLSVRVLSPEHPLYAECVDLTPAYSELVNDKVCGTYMGWI